MKVLLLDAAFGAAPIHRSLSEHHEVWTIGKRPNDFLAVKHPDRWINADYSDSLILRSICSDMGFDALVPGCTDVSMRTYVEVGHGRYCKGSLDTDLILNKKSRFRRMCLDLGVPSPRVFDVASLPISGHLICKPADSFSGRGVSVVEASDEAAVTRALLLATSQSPTSEIVIEEFVDGPLFSYSAFIEKEAVVHEFVVREGSKYDRFAVDCSYFVGNIDKHKLNSLRGLVERIAQHLHLCDGLLHVQFIDGQHGVSVIEMTRRCPGDLYSKLIEDSCGFPYAAKYASYFLSEALNTRETLDRRFVLRHTLKQKASTTFAGLHVTHANGRAELIPVVRLGDKLVGTGYVRVGIGFFHSWSQAEVEAEFLALCGGTVD